MKPENKGNFNFDSSLKDVVVIVRSWIDVPQDKNYWRAFVSMALNLQIPYVVELIIHV